MRQCARKALTGYNISVDCSAEEQYFDFIESYGSEETLRLSDIYDCIQELKDEGRKNSEFNY